METSVASDYELMKAFREGNEKAFQSIYKMFSKQLHYFAIRLTQDTLSAEEIVNDIFSTLFIRRTGFETLINVKAFLFISVKNRSLNYIKSRQRHRISPIEEEMAHNMTDEAMVAEMARAELLNQIYLEIESLPRTQKSVFKLFFIDGFTTDEICAKLNLSSSAVWSHKSAAIKKLKENPIIKRMLSLVFLLIKLYTTLVSRQNSSHYC